MTDLFLTQAVRLSPCLPGQITRPRSTERCVRNRTIVAVPSQHYDPTNHSNQYYVKDVRVKRGSTSFNRYRDYEFSSMGELSASSGPIPEGAQDLTFEVDIYDGHPVVRTSPSHHRSLR